MRIPNPAPANFLERKKAIPPLRHCSFTPAISKKSMKPKASAEGEQYRNSYTQEANTRTDSKDPWSPVPLDLPVDIELALLDRQFGKAAETPSEKALETIGKDLREANYPVILRLPRNGAPRLYIGEKVEATLKWQIEPYLPDEQPEFYAETDYYFDEACLELWVCGVKVESTLCIENFYARLRELRTMNPGLF